MVTCAVLLQGFKPVQIWPDQDLLQGWSGGVPGEAASGPAPRGLRDPPEACPGLEPEEVVPPDQRGRHRAAAVRSRTETDPVRSFKKVQVQLDYSCLFVLPISSECLLTMVCSPNSKMVSAAAIKHGWAALVLQRHWRGYRMRQIYLLVRLSTVTIQAFTRGWIARRRYKKV